MWEYDPVTAACPLFRDVPEDQLPGLLRCLGAEYRDYGKNEFVFHAGEQTRRMGLLLSGGLHILREDVWGSRELVARVGPGELFAEVYACLPRRPLEVAVEAEGPSRVLFLEAGRVIEPCGARCPFHCGLTRRLLLILAEKNLMMSEKLAHTARRTTREKLLSYLSAQARRQGSPRFQIPFDRQQLADYLGVDRSAMSAVLCRMRDEGILEFHRNSFYLKL